MGEWVSRKWFTPTIPPKEGEVHADYADGADDFIKQSCVCGFCICQPMTIFHTELHRTTQTKEHTDFAQRIIQCNSVHSVCICQPMTIYYTELHRLKS